MKISILIPELYPGGAETVSVTLCCEAPDRFELITVKGVNPVGLSLELTRNRNLILYAFKNRKFFRGSTLLINMTELIAYSFVFSLIRVPYYVRLANPMEDFRKFSLLKRYVLQILSFISIRLSKGVIYNSDYTAKSFAKWTAKKRSIRIYNPILETFKTHGNKPVSKNIDLLWVGRLEDQKDPLAFISMLKELKDKYEYTPNTILIGKGSLNTEVYRRICDYKLENTVKIIPPVSHEMLSSYYRLSKIYVITSKFEGFGNTLVEAYLAGCKIWVKNTGGSLKELTEILKIKPNQNLDDIVTLLNDTTIEGMRSLPMELNEKNIIEDYIKFTQCM